MITVSVVIPTYNEELAIEENLAILFHTLKEWKGSWEIVLVNDGSTDATLSIVEAIAKEEPRLRVISYQKNRGRGFALKTGFKEAKGKYIVATESDLNWGSDIVVRFVTELEKGGADIVVASPHMRGGSMENVPFHRWLLSFLGNKIFSLALPGDLTMVTGMTRGYKREVLNALDLESDEKDLHVEIIAKALDLGFRVTEIPAVLRWKKPEPGKPVRKSHFKLKSIIRHLLLSFDVRPFLLFGFVGIFLVLLGLVFGIYLLSLSLSGTAVAGRPLLSFAVLCIVVGFQILVFGFLATQNRDIKRQITRTQKMLKDLERGKE